MKKQQWKLKIEINAFTEKVEVIDIKQNFVKGDRYNDIYLFVTVLYK